MNKLKRDDILNVIEAVNLYPKEIFYDGKNVVELRDRLRLILNNYCEHKWDNSCCGCTKGIYCEKCSINLVSEEDWDEDTM